VVHHCQIKEVCCVFMNHEAGEEYNLQVQLVVPVGRDFTMSNSCCRTTSDLHGIPLETEQKSSGLARYL
jgi:hypothetical protein